MKLLIVLLAGLMLALLAEFALEGWADRNQVAHWTQHGLIFWGGVGVGVGIFGLYLRGQRRV